MPKIHRHRAISILGINTAENCLKGSKVYSVCYLFTLCVTAHLANQMELYCPGWPPPTLVAEGCN